MSHHKGQGVQQGRVQWGWRQQLRLRQGQQTTWRTWWKFFWFFLEGLKWMTPWLFGQWWTDAYLHFHLGFYTELQTNSFQCLKVHAVLWSIKHSFCMHFYRLDRRVANQTRAEVGEYPFSNSRRSKHVFVLSVEENVDVNFTFVCGYQCQLYTNHFFFVSLFHSDW